MPRQLVFESKKGSPEEHQSTALTIHNLADYTQTCSLHDCIVRSNRRDVRDNEKSAYLAEDVLHSQGHLKAGGLPLAEILDII